MNIIQLSEKRYAVRFMYHQVTEMTVFRSIPSSSCLFGKHLKYTEEKKDEAGKMRLDNGVFSELFPFELKAFERTGESKKNYIMVETID